jgi:hypothetical protein
MSKNLVEKRGAGLVVGTEPYIQNRFEVGWGRDVRMGSGNN